MKGETAFQAEETATLLQEEGRGHCGWSRVRWNRGEGNTCTDRQEPGERPWSPSEPDLHPTSPRTPVEKDQVCFEKQPLAARENGLGERQGKF